MVRSVNVMDINGNINNNNYNMAIKKIGKNKWKWGNTGKVYPTKSQAEKQQTDIYASGWKENSKKNSKNK